MKKKTSQAESNVNNPRNGDNTESLLDKIRRRAYELYEQRGREHGKHHEDWVQAETEISSDTKKDAA